MNQERTYLVAGHRFCINAEEGAFIWSLMTDCYGPFTAEDIGERRFTLYVNDLEELPDDAELVYTNRDVVEDGFIILDVYRSAAGHHFLMTQPRSDAPNGCLYISADYSLARVSLCGRQIEQWMTFTAAVDFCYLLSTSSYDTVLTHASAVIYKGRAYLFLGKSGTGKSTHSRMWQSVLDDVVLLNDDHPVIRLDDDGKPFAYGTPWSGKTRCYKNLKAPLGGVIRISRAAHNKARRLSPVQAYASLMTSCSGMTWERDLADGRDRTMQGIVSATPFWVMECLPDADAAKVCSEAVTRVWEEV